MRPREEQPRKMVNRHRYAKHGLVFLLVPIYFRQKSLVWEAEAFLSILLMLLLLPLRAYDFPNENLRAHQVISEQNSVNEQL